MRSSGPDRPSILIDAIVVLNVELLVTSHTHHNLSESTSTFDPLPLVHILGSHDTLSNICIYRVYRIQHGI